MEKIPSGTWVVVAARDSARVFGNVGDERKLSLRQDKLLSLRISLLSLRISLATTRLLAALLSLRRRGLPLAGLTINRLLAFTLLRLLLLDLPRIVPLLSGLLLDRLPLERLAFAPLAISCLLALALACLLLLVLPLLKALPLDRLPLAPLTVGGLLPLVLPRIHLPLLPGTLIGFLATCVNRRRRRRRWPNRRGRFCGFAATALLGRARACGRRAAIQCRALCRGSIAASGCGITHIHRTRLFTDHAHARIFCTRICTATRRPLRCSNRSSGCRLQRLLARRKRRLTLGWCGGCNRLATERVVAAALLLRRGCIAHHAGQGGGDAGQMAHLGPRGVLHIDLHHRLPHRLRIDEDRVRHHRDRAGRPRTRSDTGRPSVFSTISWKRGLPSARS